LLAVLLGVVSTAIGMILYRYGEAFIKYKGARFGGAVAIAGVAFYFMSEFYFRNVAVVDKTQEQAIQELRLAVHEYDTCVAHEADNEVFGCKFQADSLRDTAKALLD
jgi:hypothetical protein